MDKSFSSSFAGNPIFRRWFFLIFGWTLAFSVSAAYIMSGGFLLLSIVQWRQGSRKKLNGVEWGTLIFILIGLITTVSNHSASFTKSLSSQSAILLLFLTARFTSIDDIKALASGFFFAAAAAGLMGFLQLFTGVNFLPTQNYYYKPKFMDYYSRSILEGFATYNGRGVGTRSHPLTFAETLMPAAFLGLTLLLWTKPLKWPLSPTIVKILCGLGCIFAGIIASKGRAVWIATAIGSTIILFSSPLKRRTKIYICLLAIGLAGILFQTSPTLKSRVESLINPSSATAQDNQSKSIRMYLWKESISTIKSNPGGVGIKGVKLDISYYSPAADRIWTEAHNIYLQAGLERGVLGLAILILILLLIFRVAWTFRGPPRIFYVATLFGFILVGFTESWLKDKEIAFIFWILAGTVFSIKNQNSSNHQKN